MRITGDHKVQLLNAEHWLEILALYIFQVIFYEIIQIIILEISLSNFPVAKFLHTRLARLKISVLHIETSPRTPKWYGKGHSSIEEGKDISVSLTLSWGHQWYTVHFFILQVALIYVRAWILSQSPNPGQPLYPLATVGYWVIEHCSLWTIKTQMEITRILWK